MAQILNMPINFNRLKIKKIDGTPQLEPFDRAFEDSKKQFDLKLAQEKERMEGTFAVAKEKVKK